MGTRRGLPTNYTRKFAWQWRNGRDRPSGRHVHYGSRIARTRCANESGPSDQNANFARTLKTFFTTRRHRCPNSSERISSSCRRVAFPSTETNVKSATVSLLTSCPQHRRDESDEVILSNVDGGVPMHVRQTKCDKCGGGVNLKRSTVRGASYNFFSHLCTKETLVKRWQKKIIIIETISNTKLRMYGNYYRKSWRVTRWVAILWCFRTWE